MTKIIKMRFNWAELTYIVRRFRWKTVRVKLVVGFGMVLIGSAISGYLSVSFLSQMNNELDSLANRSSQKVILANELKQGILAVGHAEKKLILVGSTGLKQIQAEVLIEQITAIDIKLVDLREFAKSDAELSQLLIQFNTIWQQYLQVHRQVVYQSRKNSNGEAKFVADEWSRPAYNEMFAQAQAMYQSALAEQTSSELNVVQALSNATLSDELHREVLRLSREKRRWAMTSDYDERLAANKNISLFDKQVLELVQDLGASNDNSLRLVNKFTLAWKDYRDTAGYSMPPTQHKKGMQVAEPKLLFAESVLEELRGYNTKTLAELNQQAQVAAYYLDKLKLVRDLMIGLQMNEQSIVSSRVTEKMQVVLDNSKLKHESVTAQFVLLADYVRAEDLLVLQKKYDDFIDLHYEVADIILENGDVVAFAMSTMEGGPLADQAEAVLNQIIANSNATMQSDFTSGVAVYEKARWTTILLLAFSLVGGIAMAAWIAISISKGLSRLVRLARSVRDEGDFSHRANITTADEIGSVARAVDSLLDQLQGSISSANRVLGAVAEGDFSQRLDSNVKGDLATLQKGVNNSASSVDRTIHALEQVMKALAEFDFSARMDQQVSGEFRTLVDTSMAQMDSAISDIQEVMAQVSQGDFGVRIGTPLSGGMGVLKDSINLSLDGLESALHETSEVMAKQAGGDLVTQVEGQFGGTLNELKEALNTSSSNLASTMIQVSSTAGSVTTMASRVAKASHDLSQRTQSQASSLEQTAASMEQMTVTVTENSAHADQAKQYAQEALQSANASGEVADQAIRSMSDISESSRKVADIVELIDGIAFQTNLLALNAAVEAARAGDQGRGFAVVAGEVRSLAHKTAEASKDIKQLITVSLTRIEQGVEYVDQSGVAMREINTAIRQVSEYVVKIAGASAEQRTSIQQVSAAVNSMDSLTRQNAAIVDETSDASRDLNQQAQELMRQIEGFKLN
jgi:methyl-accepting chemotaxis protein